MFSVGDISHKWLRGCVAFAFCFGACVTLASANEGDADIDGGEAVSSRLLQHVYWEQAEVGGRYRYMDTQRGTALDRDLQWKSSIKVAVSFWGEWTAIKLRVETGSTFSSSWSYSGVGLHNQGLAFNVKTFYLAQKLNRYGALRVGSFDFDQGAGTEATYADSDGWLSGYRLGLGGWKTNRWRPDRVGVTSGFIGDFKVPNAFARLYRLGDPNYVQILAAKKIRGIDGSMEFDSIQAITFVRPAMRIGKIPGHVVDDATLEGMIRLNNNASAGWAGTLSKKFGIAKHWTAHATLSDIPQPLFRKGTQEILLNGDSVGLGWRMGGGLRFVPMKNMEVATFVSRGWAEIVIGSRWRAQLGVRYQLGELMNRILR